ncbi:HVA22-like protein [Rhynchospora pubera]|uniref:HVA22-like protein n=1 Tax=Rhynchospora pubera TaxID=906938 RepID=A0AAV8F9L0_9POAL|nr:HVA22-like protein [Rhynchospora pubera]
MELIGSQLSGDMGLKVLLSPLSSNIVSRTACCAVGIGLPVYSTFKAIEKKDQIAQERWLVYWAVYGTFSVAEIFSDKILSWVPFYYHAKLAFLIWLQLPPNYGAKELYARYLKKVLLKHQARIDKILGIASNEINKFISSHQVEIDFFKAVAVKCAMQAKEIVSDTNPESSINGQNSTSRRLTNGSDDN